MGKGTLTIYNASAGSGKTYTLAAIYLKHLFKSRYNYRRILAVTFTNKATAEMKSRIIENLFKLSSGEGSDYLSDLVENNRHDRGGDQERGKRNSEFNTS
jgi:ATP-dependent helicase/nuclease subunit A